MRTNKRQPFSLMGFTFGILLLVLAGGCRTQIKTKGASVFYPPPPDKPRIQFLVGLSTSELLTYVSPLKRFVMGPPSVISFGKPYGLKMRDGKVFICDTGYGGVLVADFANTSFSGLSTIGGGKLKKPIDMDIDDDGNYYVVDAARGQVFAYGPDNACKWIVGDIKKTMKPVDVAVSGSKLYVADMKGHTVKVYDRKTQKLLTEIPNNATELSADHKLFQPISIALCEDGGILVVDAGAFKVQHYDREGNYVKSIGEHGDLPGQFARPKGIAVDRAERAYVVDALSGVVQIFNKEGQLLTFFGEKGSRASLVLPADVEINYDGIELFRKYIDPKFEVEYLVLVSSQYGLRKLSVFGFGRMKEL